MDQDQRWDRIIKTFFRRPAKPSRAQTELFVQNLMSRIEVEGRGSLPAMLLNWLEARWLIPALGAGAAAFFLYIAQPHSEWVAPMDDLVLMDERNPRAGQLILPPDPEEENLLAFVSEDR